MPKFSLKKSFIFSFSTLLISNGYATGNINNLELLGGIPVPPSIYNAASNNDFIQNDPAHSIAQTTEHNRIPSLLNILSQYPNHIPPVLIGIKAEFDTAFSDNTSYTYVPAFNGYDSSKQTYTHTWMDKWRTPMVLTYRDHWHAEIQPQAKESGVTILEGSVFYGDLRTSPLYAYIGQEYIDFAPFYTFIPYNDPLNKDYFRPLPHGTSGLGFENHHVLSEFSVFRTESANNQDTQLNNFAYEFVYQFNLPNANNLKLGASYLDNINKTGSGLTNLSANGNHHLPALDLNAYFSWQPFAVLAEYDTTTQKVENIDQKDVNISAYDFEFSYNSTFFTKPTSYALGYSKTLNLNGVNGIGNGPPPGLENPQTQLGENDMFSASMAVETAKNFYLSLEFDRVSQYTELSTSSPKGYYNIVTADCVWFF